MKDTRKKYIYTDLMDKVLMKEDSYILPEGHHEEVELVEEDRYDLEETCYGCTHANQHTHLKSMGSYNYTSLIAYMCRKSGTIQMTYRTKIIIVREAYWRVGEHKHASPRNGSKVFLQWKA